MRPRTLERGLLLGFKKPDTFRLAPSPLYTTYAEIWQAVSMLRDISHAASPASDAE